MLSLKNKPLFLIFTLFFIHNSSAQIDEYLKELDRLKNNIDKIKIEPKKDSIKIKKILKHGESFELTSKDSSNNTATFQILIITQTHQWKFADTTNIEKGSLTTILPDYLSRLPNFLISNNIIAVGTASYEGNESKEFNRSQVRAKTIVNVIKQNLDLSNNRKFYILPIGKFKYSNSEYRNDSSHQRPVIIVGTIDSKTDPDIDIKQALYNALTNNEVIKIDLEKYSRISDMKLEEY